MKRIFFGVFLIIMVIGLTGCATTVKESPKEKDPYGLPFDPTLKPGSIGDDGPGCYDTDEGKDYYLRGTIYVDDEYHNQDVCSSPNVEVLNEWYCEDGVQQVENYVCPYGCSDGACVLTPGGIFDILNKCEIKTSVDCYEETTDFFMCNTCDKVCNVLKDSSTCITAAKSRYEGEIDYIPHYFQPIEPDSVQSIVQFRLFCTCCTI